MNLWTLVTSINCKKSETSQVGSRATPAGIHSTADIASSMLREGLWRILHTSFLPIVNKNKYGHKFCQVGEYATQPITWVDCTLSWEHDANSSVYLLSAASTVELSREGRRRDVSLIYHRLAAGGRDTMRIILMLRLESKSWRRLRKIETEMPSAWYV